MGQAEARDLGLDGGVLYDPVANYDRVHKKIWDWGGDGEPVPVATRTVQSPTQYAAVRRELDPLLDSPVDRNPALTTGKDAPSRQ